MLRGLWRLSRLSLGQMRTLAWGLGEQPKVITLMSWMSVRCFAKKPSMKDRKKEKHAQEKQSVAREFEGQDEDDVLQDIKARLESVVAGLNAELRQIVMAKVSPKLFEKVVIVVDKARRPLADLADIVIKNANTLFVIPHDDNLKETIYQVLTTPDVVASCLLQDRT